MKGLLEFLSSHLDIRENGQRIPKKRKLSAVISENSQLSIGANFINAGYWVALAAFCKSKPIEFDNIEFIYPKTREYASAIALKQALSGIDNYQYDRKNSGLNYSELVLLNNPDDTDKATKAINGCIRNLFSDHESSGFVKDLCDVVADLHDNVWSHGQITGFSMAQKWPKSKTSSEFEFEFALADYGLGFLRELKRVGLPVQSDEEAISWCIKKGNSSKKLKIRDEFSQRLPVDISHNPISAISHVSMSENNHMGLGLAKLIELISNYNGQLWLASGEQTLVIDNDGNRRFQNNLQYWQGVALACRFDSEKINGNKDSTLDEITASIVELLRMGNL